MPNQRSNFTPRAVISMIVILAIVLIAVLLSAAMQAGGWMFFGLIVGLVALAALTAWLVSFIVRLYVQWGEARNKSREAQNNFTLSLLRAGYLPDGRGGYKPIQQLPAPAPKPKDIAPNDPRKQLLIELCLMTIRAADYGPTSHRLMTADDAQEISKARGGAFADRNAWTNASQYAQDNYLVFEKRGGKEQGMMIDSKRVGGDTISDLISVLMRNPVRDAAVNALPGIDR